MSWRLRLSVETILRLTPAVPGSTVFSIARLPDHFAYELGSRAYGAISLLSIRIAHEKGATNVAGG